MCPTELHNRPQWTVSDASRTTRLPQPAGSELCICLILPFDVTESDRNVPLGNVKRFVSYGKQTKQLGWSDDNSDYIVALLCSQTCSHHNVSITAFIKPFKNKYDDIVIYPINNFDHKRRFNATFDSCTNNAAPFIFGQVWKVIKMERRCD